MLFILMLNISPVEENTQDRLGPCDSWLSCFFFSHVEQYGLCWESPQITSSSSERLSCIRTHLNKQHAFSNGWYCMCARARTPVHMCMCGCVRVCVCMRTCVCVCMHVYASVYVCLCMSACVYVCVSVYVHVSVCTYVGGNRFSFHAVQTSF